MTSHNAPHTPNAGIRILHDMLYLITMPDLENGRPIVICTAPNHETGNAVIKSDSRLSCWQIYTNKGWTRPEMKHTNFDDLDHIYTVKKEDVVTRTLLDAQLASELRSFREQVRLRVGYLDALLCECYLALQISSENPVLAKHIDSIMHELSLCNHERQEYTTGISDYAHIQGISEETAFMELTMHANEIRSTKLRNYAIYLLCRNEMNEVPATHEALKKVLLKARDLLSNNRLL